MRANSRSGIEMRRRVVSYDLSNGRGHTSRCHTHQPEGGYQVYKGEHWGACDMCDLLGCDLAAALGAVRNELKTAGYDWPQVDALASVRTIPEAGKLLAWVEESIGARGSEASRRIGTAHDAARTILRAINSRA